MFLLFKFLCNGIYVFLLFVYILFVCIFSKFVIYFCVYIFKIYYILIILIIIYVIYINIYNGIETNTTAERIFNIFKRIIKIIYPFIHTAYEGSFFVFQVYYYLLLVYINYKLLFPILPFFMLQKFFLPIYVCIHIYMYIYIHNSSALYIDFLVWSPYIYRRLIIIHYT